MHIKKISTLAIAFLTIGCASLKAADSQSVEFYSTDGAVFRHWDAINVSVLAPNEVEEINVNIILEGEREPTTGRLKDVKEAVVVFENGNAIDISQDLIQSLIEYPTLSSLVFRTGESIAKNKYVPYAEILLPFGLRDMSGKCLEYDGWPKMLVITVLESGDVETELFDECDK